MSLSTILILYVSLFPVSWFLIGLVDLFIDMEKSSRLKLLGGLGEKIIYSGVALLSAGVYDLMNTKQVFDGLLLFISFPTAWAGMKLVHFSQERKNAY